MRMLALQGDNYKKIKAIRLEFTDGALIQLTGKNNQGKTSVIDLIREMLGGAKEGIEEPVRQGSSGASGTLLLDELRIEKRWGPEGRPTLHVSSADGRQPFASGQDMLDGLLNKISFDPREFARSTAKKQAAILQALAGLDFTKLIEERDRIYAERTAVNKVFKERDALVKSLPVPAADTPDQLVSVAEIANEQQRLLNEAKGHAQLAADLEHAKREHARIENQISGLRTQLRDQQGRVENLEGLLAERPEAGNADALTQQLNAAEAVNSQVRAKARRAEALGHRDASKAESERITARLKAIDEEMAQAKAAAQYPVPGLAITADEDVLYNGVPFSQCSSSEQLRVSTTMAFCLNPQLKIAFVEDGALLDPDGLLAMAQVAEEHQGQLVIETTTGGEPVGVVIEDGEVAGIYPPGAPVASGVAGVEEGESPVLFDGDA